MADISRTPTTDTTTLGSYLRLARDAAHMTLRDVEAATDRGVTNGYLSQIESGDIRQPSPRVLHHLATVYGIDFSELMMRAGHHTPATPGAPRVVASGFPLRAVEDLTPKQQEDLLQYIAFLKKRG